MGMTIEEIEKRLEELYIMICKMHDTQTKIEIDVERSNLIHEKVFKILKVMINAVDEPFLKRS